jgi:hypothetical protein
MSEPVYRIAQEFLRIEAIGSRGARSGDPADPIDLEARVTLSNDIDKIVESRFMSKIQDKSRLYKHQVGLWIFELQPSLYERGKAYTIHWRYSMTPNNVNVVRKNFIWDPIVDTPRNPKNCIIYGLLCDMAGVPVSGERLVVERYKNFVTLNHRTAQNTVESNPFGLWSIELPQKEIVRVVFGNLSKVIQIPEKSRVALAEIADYQPEVKQKDKFGYPFPGDTNR